MQLYQIEYRYQSRPEPYEPMPFPEREESTCMTMSMKKMTEVLSTALRGEIDRQCTIERSVDQLETSGVTHATLSAFLDIIAAGERFVSKTEAAEANLPLQLAKLRRQCEASSLNRDDEM